MRGRGASGLLVVAAALGLGGAADANGRFPQTVAVHLPPAGEATVLAPATIGLLISADGGERFYWVCEDAIGYAGTYDPDYAVAADGTLYATTFAGLRTSVDGGCTWAAASQVLGERFVEQVELGPDGAVWAALSGPEGGTLYVRRDGDDFAPTALAHPGALWAGLKVAPSDPQRVYLSGREPAERSSPMLLYRSTDGGASVTALPVDAFQVTDASTLEVLAVSPVDADVVFVRVAYASLPLGDAIYRSTDGGLSWTKVLEVLDELPALVVRADGQTVIAGGDSTGTYLSTDGGASFANIDYKPLMACLAESSEGRLLACGSNWAPDYFALGRSIDGQTWTPLVRFSGLAGALACPAGTIQRDTCEAEQWPQLVEQFGIGEDDADAGPSAPSDAGSDPLDAGGRPDAGGIGGSDGCGGCSVALAFPLLLVAPRRRRR